MSNANGGQMAGMLASTLVGGGQTGNTIQSLASTLFG